MYTIYQSSSAIRSPLPFHTVARNWPISAHNLGHGFTRAFGSAGFRIKRLPKLLLFYYSIAVIRQNCDFAIIIVTVGCGNSWMMIFVPLTATKTRKGDSINAEPCWGANIVMQDHRSWELGHVHASKLSTPTSDAFFLLPGARYDTR